MDENRTTHGAFVRRKTNLSEISFTDFQNPWTFSYLFLSSQKDILDWLMEHKLLANELKCLHCENDCKISRRSRNIDGYSWRCTSNRNHEFTLRKFSFFEGSKFPIQDIMQFLLSFLERNTLLRSAIKSGMDYKKTSVDWASYCREILKHFVFTQYLDEENPLRLSGQIEIDESLFGRRFKYNKGQKK